MTAPAREFTAEEIGESGVSDEYVGLDLAGKPGSAVFTGSGDDEVVRARMSSTTTDPTEYQIYDREGRAWRMPKLVALIRLKKRYPASDHRYPGMPVFLPQQVKVPPEAQLDCPALAEVGCRKKFATALMADQHMRSRHRGTWSLREEQRQRDMQDRAVRASEMQTEAMTRMLERMGGESLPIPEAPEAELLPFEPSPDEIEADVLKAAWADFNVDTASHKELIAYASAHGTAKFAGYATPIQMKSDELRTAIVLQREESA